MIWHVGWKVAMTTACLLVTCGRVQGLGHVILSGDVYIEYVGAVYEDSSCTHVSPETVQNIQAIKWILTRLNNENFINGTKLGLRINPTCGSVENAKSIAHQLAVEMASSSTTDIVGLIGSDYSSESAVISRLISSLPDQYRLLQVAYSSTSASLRNQDIYTNFIRPVPADDIQVKVLREFLLSMNWTMMAMIYDDDTYGNGGFEALSADAHGLDVCFPVSIPVPTDRRNVTELEEIIRRQIYRVNVTSLPTISGILIFGSYNLVEAVMQAVENIHSDPAMAGYQRPAFLLSEAGGYIEGQFTNVSKGAFILSPPKRNISSFSDDYWRPMLNSSTKLKEEANVNKYFQQMIEQLGNCQLSNSTAADYCALLEDETIKQDIRNSIFTQYAIQAAMLAAYATKTVRSKACGNINGVCQAFLNTSATPRAKMIDAIQNVDIKFDEDFKTVRIPEFRNPEHLIIRFNGSNSLTKNLFPDIRDYDVGGQEHSWPDIRKPQCPDGATSATCIAREENEFMIYEPGDMYIVGIAPVHDVGNTPLKCGNIKPGGVDMVEGIRFALKDLKEKHFAPEAKLGLIIIDSCDDPQILQEKVLTLHRFGVYVSGRYEPVHDKILGYVGGWTSDVSTAIAQITSRLHYVQVSYASTAASLSRRQQYPYFLRVPSSDAEQVRVMLNIVRDLGGKMIQIMYSETLYGEDGRNLLKALAGQDDVNICVANEIPVSSSTTGDDVIRLLRKTPEARMVVLFVASSHISNFIEALNNDLDSNNEFLFIGSEEWGLRQNMKLYPKLAGTLAITSRLWAQDSFLNHLKSLGPSSVSEDPWIRSYLESVFNCYYQWSYNKKSRNKCTGLEQLEEGAIFHVDSWAPFAIRATDVLMAGVAERLKAVCGGTQNLCADYRDGANAANKLAAAIRHQERKSDSQDQASTPVFNENGDGTIGYRIYVYDRKGGRPKFNNTYLTAIYAEQRRQHGIDGSESPGKPKDEEDYDNIPGERYQGEIPSIHGKRYQGELPSSVGNNYGRGFDGGTAGSGSIGQRSNTDESFSGGSIQTTGSATYLTNENGLQAPGSVSPPAHTFMKTFNQSEDPDYLTAREDTNNLPPLDLNSMGLETGL
ncbi:GRM7-like protein [Mya arenaria]|uniref:GRM7-like protein n=1 Tax=Mya arenaria TaxID=6604 RepID=A0ABY7E632_MYAAR|nr:GRM7-like protein [Mya arenaria]